MRKLLPLLLLLLLFVGEPQASTTYFVDPTGSDRNSGSSSSSPWKTIQKVNSVRFKPGDKVLFRRGGVWRGVTLAPRSSGASHLRRITYADYGSGAKPVIDVSGPLPSWNSGWSYYGSGIWQKGVSDHPKRLYCGRGPETGVTTEGELTCAGSLGEVSQSYRWWCTANSSGTLYVWTGSSTQSPAAAYPVLEGAYIGTAHALDLGDDNGARSYLSFINLDFRGGSTCIAIRDAARRQGSNYIIFDSCNISARTGNYSMFITDNSDHGIIRNCRIDKKDYCFHTYEYGGNLRGTGNATDNISNQGGSYWEIHHNYVAGFGHDGIGCNTAGDNSTRASYNKIHDNELVGTNDYGRAFNIQGSNQGYNSQGRIAAAKYCAYNEIYNNYIHGTTEQIQFQGYANKFYYNIIDTMRFTWGGGSGTSGTQNYQCAGIDISNDSDRGGDSSMVCNNVFRNIPGAGIQVRCPHAFVINNIVVNTGTQSIGGQYGYRVGIDVWSGQSNVTVANNAVYNGGAKPMVYAQDGWASTTKLSVEEFDAHNGDQGNTLKNNIGTDPLLNADYSLDARSSCIRAGMKVGLKRDFRGTRLPLTEPPDIGAVQYFQKEVQKRRSVKVIDGHRGGLRPRHSI